MSLDKLTIVIPTYNRQAFALRSMRYWSNTNVNIIVIDGSEKSINSVILGKFKPNIKYIHGAACYYKRMLSAIPLVKTEYVLIGCDDEFYIPSALNSCITKLSLDPKLATCGGRCAKFDWKNNSVIGSNAYPKLKDLSLQDLFPTDRIKRHFSNYTPAHCYSVSRTDIWKIVIEEIYSKEYSCYAINEMQFEFLMLYAGKTLIIPELMWLRSRENEPVAGAGTTISFSRTHTFDKWWLTKNYKKDKDNFIERMENSCAKINQLNQVKYNPEVENCFDQYLKFYKNRNNYSKKNTKLAYNFLYSFFRKLPFLWQNNIKFFFKYFIRGFKQVYLIDYVKVLELERVKINFDELREVEKNIHSFYKNNT